MYQQLQKSTIYAIVFDAENFAYGNHFYPLHCHKNDYLGSLQKILLKKIHSHGNKQLENVWTYDPVGLLYRTPKI